MYTPRAGTQFRGRFKGSNTRILYFILVTPPLVNSCIQAADVCIPYASLRSKSWLVRLRTVLQGTVHILALLWMDNGRPWNGFIRHIILKTKHECKQISRSIILTRINCLMNIWLQNFYKMSAEISCKR